MGGRAVAADAVHECARVLEVGVMISEATRFGSTARRVVFGVKVDDHWLAYVGADGHGLVVLVVEGERRDGVIDV